MMNGRWSKVPEYRATPEQWAALTEFLADNYDDGYAACILELRARMEALEAAAHKHIVETSANILALASRVEALEASQQQPEPIDQEENDRRFHACMNLIRNATPEQIRAAAGLPERKTSKVYEISEPLKLTPEQAQHVRDLLAPNSKPTPNSSQNGRSLVNRVALAISGIEYGLERDEEAVNWASEARAAIREVAAWLIDRRRDDDWLAPFEELADLLLEEVQQ
jgi:hypothetical protein